MNREQRRKSGIEKKPITYLMTKEQLNAMEKRAKEQALSEMKKGMEAEIDRQIKEHELKHEDEYDACVLWVLHSYLGFGKKRLREFWEAFQKEHKKLIDTYEMPDSEGWLCIEGLKEIGVDIEEWNKEVEE